MRDSDSFSVTALRLEMVRGKLRQAAKEGRLICYGEIASLVQIDIAGAQGRGELSQLLKEVCASETRSGRPMLGSLVVRKDTGMPGTGFFRGARRLGLLAGESQEDERSFWTAEVERVRQYWTDR